MRRNTGKEENARYVRKETFLCDPFNWIKCKETFFVSLRPSISCSNINSTNLWTFIYERLLFVCFRSLSCVRRHSNGEERKNIEKLFIYRSRIEFIVTMTLEREICREKEAKELFGNRKISPEAGVDSGEQHAFLSNFFFMKPIFINIVSLVQAGRSFFSAGGSTTRETRGIVNSF